MSTEETTPPTTAELAQAALVAIAFKEFVAGICDPHIKANQEHIKSTPSLRSTTAAFNGQLAVTFTESRKKPSFFVADQSAFLDYADDQGEALFVVNPAFEKAMLTNAVWDPETETVFNKRTGEPIPGLGYNPGGEVISVSPTWTEGGRAAARARMEELFGPAMKALPMIAPADDRQQSDPVPEPER
ncbi:hypothetical protein ACIQ9R_36335 [Streptomyces sp. NPDC094447]|uniref:hypothetical protein n=1 Tax=Streptomyces sp. NPDC094447 TaxID=3366062 RepID=UPI00382B525F